ncbi:MAG: hypothetical protein ACI4LX_09415 [Treponema sp.]
MKTIKEMTGELNSRYSELAGKIILSAGLFLLLVFSSYLVLMTVSFAAAQIFSGAFAVLMSFLLMLLVYALVFVFHYGFIILLLRLERKMSASLGYLFLGFKHKRISALVCLFTFFLFVCICVSAVPIFLNIDFSTQDSMMQIFKDMSRLTLVLKLVALIFFCCFLVFFFPCVFAWTIVYDNADITGLKAVSKSARMLKGHFFNFLFFELNVNKTYILVLLGIELVKDLFYFVIKKDLGMFFNYIFSFVNFICVILLFSKGSLAIPFYYNKLCEQDNRQ